jgi:hypothetical protein
VCQGVEFRHTPFSSREVDVEVFNSFSVAITANCLALPSIGL